MLSTDLSKLKKDVDERSEYLIFGFVREAQKLLPSDKSYFNITDLITFGILSFYYIKNEWDQELTSDYYKIEDDCCSVIKPSNGVTNAYIKGVIDKGIHSWKFKVEHFEQDTYKWFDFVIGVVDQNHSFKEPVNHQSRWFAGSKAHKYIRNRYGKLLKQDDIIEMIINMNEKSLKYIINGHDYGKACDLEKGSKYRAAIYMFCVGNKLRII